MRTVTFYFGRLGHFPGTPDARGCSSPTSQPEADVAPSPNTTHGWASPSAKHYVQHYGVTATTMGLSPN